jgi:hypothetical protein
VPNTSPYRLVQWTTGNVGKSSVAAIARNPPSNSWAATAWSPDKAGLDVGVLAGIEPLGVAATNDVDELLALKPDCVVYNPMWIDCAATFLLGWTRGGSPGILGVPTRLQAMLTCDYARREGLPCTELSGEKSPVYR